MAKKEKAPPGPDEVVRESAGAYVSGDGRFRVSQSDTNWFVVDTEQANEFGQELIHGPYGSLKQAQASLKGARSVKPLLRSAPRPKRPSKGAARAEPKPAPPPPSWIDRLDEAQQKDVRRLIRALEKEGLADAEDLVRRHRDDPSPHIAARLIEHRLAGVVESLPEDQRATAEAAVKAVLEALSVEGLSNAPPAPRWALIELEANVPTPKRVIRLRR